MPKLKGSRPKPRVALVGNFEEEVVKTLGNLFPTFWMAVSLNNLRKVVSSQEIDVIIIGDYNPPSSGILDDGFITDAHIICFSNSVYSLPGPIEVAIYSEWVDPRMKNILSPTCRLKNIIY